MKKNSMQSKGGKARAKALSAEKRSEIASKAAKVKWSLPKALFGNTEKKLKLGERELECYVLEDGRRVLTGRGMQEALNLGNSHGGILRDFLTQKAFKPFVDNDLAMAFENPLQFIRPGRGGVPALAYEATILPKLCDVVLEARKQGALTGERQKQIAEQCEIIVRVLSQVGIIALVDEVTGYQQVRDREALQKILDKYLTDEWSKWSKIFPDEFYKEMFRLKNVEFLNNKGTQKPSYVGHWTNDIVYSRLAPGIVTELKSKNPRINTSNTRARKHHQHLTKDYGHPSLKEHLSNVTFLMKTCDNDTEFKAKLDKVAPKYGNVIPVS